MAAPDHTSLPSDMRPNLTRSHALAGALALALATTAHAQASSSSAPLHGLFRFGLEHGGERVVEFEYQDGSTPDVVAGGGLLLQLGGTLRAFQRNGHALDAQATAGLKWRTIPPANNQDANWLRFPVEGLLFYRAPAGFRVGGGATVHLRNVLAASGEVLNDRVEFRNTPGFVAQAEYLRDNLAFDLRYTAMTYEIASGGSGTVGASSIGVGMSFFFGGSR